jgi:hypothetical protein
MNRQRRTDVLAWLALGIYSEIFPSAIMLVATMLVREGKLDPRVVKDFLSFSVLLALSFSILIATVGDLLFEGFYPGHWPAIIGIIFGSFLIGVIGVGAHLAADFAKAAELADVKDGIGMPVLISWFLFQIAISLLVLAYCAMVKSLMFEAQESQSNV